MRIEDNNNMTNDSTKFWNEWQMEEKKIVLDKLIYEYQKRKNFDDLFSGFFFFSGFTFLFYLMFFVIYVPFNLDIIVKYINFYGKNQWDLMYIWLIFIVPIINIFLCLNKLIDGSFKFYYNKYLERFSQEKLTIFKIYAYFQILLEFIFFNNYAEYINHKYIKNFIYTFAKINYITFFLSIYSFFCRFLKNPLLNNQVLSGDLFFIFLPFILSFILILNNPFKNYEF